MKSRFIVLLAIFSILLSSCTLSLAEDITPPPDYKTPTPAPTMSPLFPAQAPDLTTGAAIFATECAPCHGEKGLGDGTMAAQLQKQPTALGKPEMARAAAPANWFTTVTQGNMQSFMPPFNSKLDDQQRWDVVAYAISLGTTPDEIAQGKIVYEANCAQCHGVDGKSSPSVDLTDQAVMAKLTQNDIVGFINKGVGTMPGFGGAIGDADTYAVAAYLRTFTFPIGQLAAAAPTPTSAATPASTPAESGTTTPEGTLAPTEVSAAAATPAEAAGNISGKVTNGSGGAIPTGLKAVLHTFDHDTTTQQFNEAAPQEAPVTADGAYMFANLSMAPNRAYYVSVDYAGTTYESDSAIPQKDGKTTYDLPIVIYDTTTDMSGLAAEQVHVILDYSKPDLVQVIEFFIITNPGTKTIVPAEKGGPVIQVSLPKGYANLQFEQGAIGDRYLKTADGFADTGSIAPGAQKYQIVFAFDLPLPKPGLFGGQKLEFTQPLSIDAKAVSVLVPEGITLSSSTFSPGGTQDMGTGGKFQVYNAVSLEAGKNLDISASGAPQTAAQPVTGTNTTKNIIIGVGALGVVLILAGVWLFWRDRQRSGETDDEDLDDEDELEDEDMEEILDAIVALDDQFKAGNLSEDAYQERRAQLKAKLKGNL
jgi:mono/diheme cytochrome c family protein